MAITSTVNKHIFNLNGTQTVFPFSFKIFTPSTDLTVIHRTAAGVETVLTYASDYTVAAVDEDYTNGGNVTLADPYSNGDQLVISREMQLTQETDYTENDPFPAETHENALDKLTMIAQQLDEKIGRNLTVPITDSNPGDLPNATDRAGNFLAFDASGDPIAAAAVTGVPVTPFMQTLLDDVDAAAGLATLGITTRAADDVDVADSGGYFVSGDAESVLAEIGAEFSNRKATLAYWDLPTTGNADGDIRFCIEPFPGVFYWSAARGAWFPLWVSSSLNLIWDAATGNFSGNAGQRWLNDLGNPLLTSRETYWILDGVSTLNANVNLGALIVGHNGEMVGAGFRLSYFWSPVILLGPVPSAAIHSFRGDTTGSLGGGALYCASTVTLGELELNLSTATWRVRLLGDVNVVTVDLTQGILFLNGNTLYVTGDFSITLTNGGITNTAGTVVFQKGGVDQLVDPGTGNPNFGDVQVLVSGTRVEQQADMQVEDLFLDTGTIWDRNGFTLTINGSQTGGGTLV